MSAQPSVAGSGWDYVGTSQFRDPEVDEYTDYVAGPRKSAGGNFLTCITTSATEESNYSLYEKDPGNDDYVATYWGGAGCLEWKNISRFVDGKNNRAEFYVVTGGESAVRVKFYDWPRASHRLNKIPRLEYLYPSACWGINWRPRVIESRVFLGR
ncbi:hypothetical protein [Streptomyces sp. NBC_01235]|uniref:hypothetical protein n=1 Tax=Streptomyces sp. NBC_01235 TaxID=2903788 RepID=UPI002E12126F|nr:hypothetical protein OG289_00265 [Streptomyces sp. NBC_01235]